MFSKLTSLAAVASCLYAGGIARQVLESAIPPEEALRLSQIVEDEPPPPSSARKGQISPDFPLIFRQPLPIPPVKQPKQ